MKTFRKLTVLVLIMSMLLTTLLVGCTKSNDENEANPQTTTEANGSVTDNSTTDNSATNNPVTDYSTTEYDPLEKLPATDFEEHIFNILIPAHTWAIVNMTCPDITADTIQNSIYTRQVNIEERLNISLSEEIASYDVANKILQVSSATSDESYDLALMPTFNALSLYTKGVIVDQASMDGIDFDNPWWETDFMEDVNIGDKRYISFGNSHLTYYSSFYIFAFNKSIINSYSLENPYELVTSGDWTWDKAYSMIETAATDNEGDGIYKPGDDLLGLTGHVNHCRNLILSSGFQITGTDSEGYPKYDGLSPSYIDAFEKFTDYFITSPYVAIAGRSPSPYAGYSSAGGASNYVQVFMDGKSLFLSTATNEVIALRQAETEYGIVVIPKFTKEQKDYVTPVYSAVDGFVIPSNSEDPDRTALIFETLGAFSYQDLVDKHIRIVLHSKVSQDPTAVEMISLAYANGAVDTSLANNFGTCASILNNLNTFGSKNITSTFGMIENKLKEDIDKAIEAVQ